jgi:NhaP-type Na+/H+ or K+/H+ antiporter
MLTDSLLLLGAALIALVLAERPMRRLPMSPALVYLALGWLAGALIFAPDAEMLAAHAAPMLVATEFAVLVSLFAVGLRLPAPVTLHAWRVALLMAGPGMVVTVVLAMVAAVALLGLPWPAALLLGALVAPTDPVLASDVQIRSEDDRDTVRLSLTAEGGLNDGTALPAALLGLGLLGLHPLGEGLRQWWLRDLVWSIGGGALVGAALGQLLGRLLRWCVRRGDPLARDELLYVGAVALAYGVARALGLSAFVVVFVVGAVLLLPLREAKLDHALQPLAQRLRDFGARCERLVEAAMVLAIGVALHGVAIGWRELAFAVALLLLVRPASVLAVVRLRTLPRRPRRLVAWFGIRGIGSLFYLAFALEHGVQDALAHTLVAATLCCVALSIVAHGLSATPLMEAHRRRRARGGAADASPPPAPPSA